jgi:hypothetical protein
MTSRVIFSFPLGWSSTITLADDPVPPFFPESDITKDTALNPRLVEADKRLIEASRELLYAVQLCVKGRKEKDGLVALLPDDNPAAAELIRDPERLSGFVSSVLDEQMKRKATLTNRILAVAVAAAIKPSMTSARTSPPAQDRWKRKPRNSERKVRI